jgi:hypothetical protein
LKAERGNKMKKGMSQHDSQSKLVLGVEATKAELVRLSETKEGAALEALQVALEAIVKWRIEKVRECNLQIAVIEQCFGSNDIHSEKDCLTHEAREVYESTLRRRLAIVTCASHIETQLRNFKIVWED